MNDKRAERIDISGMDKAEVLAALYNASKVQDMGILQQVSGNMTVERAREIIEGEQGDDHGNRGLYFDYLHGRVMKVNISGNSLNPWGYDWDVGEGAAARALSKLTSGTT